MSNKQQQDVVITAVNDTSSRVINESRQQSLERATTFSGWEDDSYNRFGDDDVFDVETWNWPVLLTRVFCFFLLFIMLVLFGLGAINKKFLVLASIVFVLLSIVLINTYINLRAHAKRFCLFCVSCCCCKKRDNDTNSPLPASEAGTASNINPLQKT